MSTGSWREMHRVRSVEENWTSGTGLGYDITRINNNIAPFFELAGYDEQEPVIYRFHRVAAPQTSVIISSVDEVL